MSHRTTFLSLTLIVSLLGAPIAQAMSWNFWTQNDYRNSWIAGLSVVGAGICYLLWQQAHKTETPEECYTRVRDLLNKMHKQYDAKITIFERAYAINADDIVVKNEQLAHAEQQWLADLNEQPLAYLEDFTKNKRDALAADVRQLSTAKIDLSKVCRQAKEDKNLSLVKQIDALIPDISLLFLRLDFLRKCVKHHATYLDFLSYERGVSKKYAHVMNVPTAQGNLNNLKQIICDHSEEKSHQYIKFVQHLNKDLSVLRKQVNEVQDGIKSTKLFQRTQNLHHTLVAIEKRIHADKTLHNDLRAYQEELIYQMKKNAKKLYSAIDRSQRKVDSVQALQRRLSVVIAAYNAYVLVNQNNGNQQNNAISDWEMDKLRKVSKNIENLFTEIQKARDQVRSLEKEIKRMPIHFNEAHGSIPEQLRLQDHVEKMIQEAESMIQTVQNVEQKAHSAADDLHRWARSNNLFLV